MAKHKWNPRREFPRDLVRPVPVDPTGRWGPTKAAAAGPSWRRTTPGLYVPTGTPTGRSEQRILEQSMRPPPHGAVTGWAACRVHGAAFHDGLQPDGITEIPVPLVVGARGGVWRDPAIKVYFERLTATDIVVRHGIPVVWPIRAVFDAMRFAGDLREAAVALDMAAAAELVSVEQMIGHIARRRGTRRIAIARKAVVLASEHSRSPNETRVRLIAVLDAGFPSDILVNPIVLSREGARIGEVDLLDLRAGLVAEFDGADHRGVLRHAHDVQKEDALRRLGLEVVRVTGPDLRINGRVAGRLIAARQRAKFVEPDDRLWVARPKPSTLHDRLDEIAVVSRLYADVDAQPLPDVRNW